jgi:PST family polysaccharide transporter
MYQSFPRKTLDGKQMLQLPAGEWLHIDIVCGLGPLANGRYDLTVRAPNEAAKVYTDVACSPKFETLNCVVFMAVGDAPRGWRADRATARQLFSESWPLMLNSAAVLLAIRIDQTMLTLMQGVHENGIYAAAQRLTEVLFFIPLAVASAAAPTLLRSHARDRAEYEHRLGRVFTLLAWSAIAIALPVSILANWLTVALFGSAFRDSGPVLALHIWSTPGLFMGAAITNWFIAEGRQGELMLRSVLGAALNIALNLGLIPAYGARGAALATLVSQTFAYVFANALFPSTRPLFRMQMRALLPLWARSERR